MAYVLAANASPRLHGFTAGLLAEAAAGAASVSGVEVETVHLTNFDFGPCKSCFHCIRGEAHMCSQNDDMGREGKGRLFSRTLRANGLILADPVYGWGPSARAHAFWERLYPFTWSGGLAGLPFASISCASNQGMHRLATEEICKWAFTKGLRYCGGLPVHTAYYDTALQQARELGESVARTALADEKQGRQKMVEEDLYLEYLGHPWSPLGPYLDNLTNGTFKLESSVIVRALAEGTFHRLSAVQALKAAAGELGKAIEEYDAGQKEEATKHLVRASAYWTRATWEEFVEPKVVKAAQPAAYRPIQDQEQK